MTSHHQGPYNPEMIINNGVAEGVPTPRLIQITPEIAETLLSRAVVNRRLDWGQVDFLADSIVSGEWQLTHQGIALDGPLDVGCLLDGQHRLNAIIKAGIPVWIYVFEGLPRTAFPVLDTGKRRSGVDTLSATGEKYLPLLHSTIRHVLLFKNMPDSPWTGNGARIANGRILAAYTEDSDMYREAVAVGREISKHVFASQTGAAVGYFVTTEAAPAVKVDSWIDGLTLGANLEVGDPRLALLKVPHMQRRSSKRRYSMREQVAIYIKAWNAWVREEKIENLRFRKTEKMPMSAEVKFER
ncbi:hypothetical protein a10_04535 [Streptomyces acidiscabies]|nr:hypothetical protein a10_04535 [Streptomyces acidiscabies]GAV41777.1 hypothetical protein Saa2_04691 [Streptomyces acidiscabies]